MTQRRPPARKLLVPWYCLLYGIRCIYHPPPGYVGYPTERVEARGTGMWLVRRTSPGVGMTRILIADDSPEMLRGIREALRDHPGWEVCGEVSDGMEAVSQAAELSPDLVILDLTMPKLNGFQAGRTIHTAAPKLPLLLFTQHEFDGRMEQEARQAGFRGGVTKGSYESLIAGIETLLRGETFFLPAEASVLEINADKASDIAEPAKTEDEGQD